MWRRDLHNSEVTDEAEKVESAGPTKTSHGDFLICVIERNFRSSSLCNGAQCFIRTTGSLPHPLDEGPDYCRRANRAIGIVGFVFSMVAELQALNFLAICVHPVLNCAGAPINGFPVPTTLAEFPIEQPHRISDSR